MASPFFCFSDSGLPGIPVFAISIPIAFLIKFKLRLRSTLSFWEDFALRALFAPSNSGTNATKKRPQWQIEVIYALGEISQPNFGWKAQCLECFGFIFITPIFCCWYKLVNNPFCLLSFQHRQLLHIRGDGVSSSGMMAFICLNTATVYCKYQGRESQGACRVSDFPSFSFGADVFNFSTLSPFRRHDSAAFWGWRRCPKKVRYWVFFWLKRRMMADNRRVKRLFRSRVFWNDFAFFSASFTSSCCKRPFCPIVPIGEVLLNWCSIMVVINTIELPPWYCICKGIRLKCRLLQHCFAFFNFLACFTLNYTTVLFFCIGMASLQRDWFCLTKEHYKASVTTVNVLLESLVFIFHFLK